MSPYSAYLHDALLLYAQTVEEMIKTEKDFWDGQQLINTLRTGQITLQGKVVSELQLLSLIPVELEMLGMSYKLAVLASSLWTWRCWACCKVHLTLL